MKKIALLLMGHGSRSSEANQELQEMASLIKKNGNYPIVEAAFLQLTEPLIEEGVERCIEKGADKIFLVPYFLYVGIHVREDLPVIVERVKERYNSVEFILTSHIGIHDKMADIVIERVQEASENN